MIPDMFILERTGVKRDNARLILQDFPQFCVRWPCMFCYKVHKQHFPLDTKSSVISIYKDRHFLYLPDAPVAFVSKTWRRMQLFMYSSKNIF